MTMLPMARLTEPFDRGHRRRILCSDMHCGTRFADWLETPDHLLQINPLWMAQVKFATGFGPNADGVWRMSQRVWKRLSQGRPPAERHAGIGFGTRRMTPSTERGGFLLNRDWTGNIVEEIECPACRLRQGIPLIDFDIIDGAVLLVAIERGAKVKATNEESDRHDVK